MSLGALPGNIVQFQFTAEGVGVFAGILGRSAASIEARVSGVDQFGIWIHTGENQVMLLKWPYIATVVAEYAASVEEKPSRPRIGFS
jgi:hypothetical protein